MGAEWEGGRGDFWVGLLTFWGVMIAWDEDYDMESQDEDGVECYYW